MNSKSYQACHSSASIRAFVMVSMLWRVRNCRFIIIINHHRAAPWTAIARNRLWGQLTSAFDMATRLLPAFGPFVCLHYLRVTYQCITVPYNWLACRLCASDDVTRSRSPGTAAELPRLTHCHLHMILLSVIAGFTVMSNRQTNRPRYVC